MSSPLAIGAVSAVLRNLLDNGLIEAGAAIATSVQVSAVAPDTIDTENPAEPPRLNLFLYQVTPNAGWRNLGLPTRNPAGERVANTPLAVDLHYLITAYARADFQAEILLGYAMHLLHERPVLDRAAIRRALEPSPLDASMLPPTFQALAAADLADQAELLKITPVVMGAEEMSRLWAAIKSSYRPSAAYQVSVVLIEAAAPARSPLPVLSRGEVDAATGRDRGVVVVPDLLPPVPTLMSIEYAARQVSARLGESITVRGVRLAGAGATASFTHRLRDEPIEVAVALAADGRQFSVALPADAAAQVDWPAGLWSLTLRFTPTGSTRVYETNAVPVSIAPEPVLVADAVLGLPAAAIERSGDPPRVLVVLASRPQVSLRQRATLMLNAFEATAAPRALASDLLRFDFPDDVPPSSVAEPTWVRLRVDGVDSVLIDRSGPMPVFRADQSLVVPP